ncbi:glycoside hydrolase family 65 protein [Actinoplanes friuliensis]|uniref:Kojibiose phosphorylase n=1 Tax=Actinoplanes friuliensis DSM 7358 TaxID=1246995 RepID=U5W8B9_9ACTN|nr:glycosyl hydrolase family 65 protein [Actinoplanes friuliensis]AGZ45252.1 Kojibiose phosphorylase [Actinoplanes friuliensis DSM 7358]
MGEIGPAEPWVVREIGLPDELRQAESVFALANGHVGLRGNLDEPEPFGMPGTYLNSLYEHRDLTYPEAGYAFPERTETIIDAPNGKLVTLTVDDEPFDVRTGDLRRHERCLDLRAGTLHREVEWGPVRITSTRLVSFPHPSVAAIRYEVEALDRPVRIRLDSDLLANEEQPEPRDDPRASAVLHAPLRSLSHSDDVLVHRTRRSGITVASSVAHVSEPGEVSAEEDRIRFTLTTVVHPGTPLRLDKFVAYAWGTGDSDDDLAGTAVRDRDEAVRAGFETLLDEQRDYLDDFWDSADVELDGDPEVQQAVRFGLFHVLQAGAQAGPHPIAAKGLTGNGYDGHMLWDTESYVLPVLTYTHPACVGLALRWRHAALPAARERAAELRLAGATYPWRTISGAECSGYWPAGTAALHVNADIADAVLRYAAAAGDDTFVREAGLEILVETARLWCRLAHEDDAGVFHLDGVTGPDEYTALVDDNIYTNLMAQRNLRGAAQYCELFPERARDLGVSADEPRAWQETADNLALPYDNRREVHEQHAGFARLQEWDFASTKDDDYPLMLHYPYLDLYRRQVVKQADLVLAMVLRGDAFTPAEKTRAFEYYEARTVRDSSLSAPAQAVLAAETGYLELAHDYLAEAALLDLRAGGEASGDGLHIAACAGVWMALVQGFGGLRDHDGQLSFAPRLPSHLPRLKFSLRWRYSRLHVTVTPTTVTYAVTDEDLSFHHYGEPVDLKAGTTVTLDLPPVEEKAAPPAPAGRAPARRRDALDR